MAERLYPIRSNDAYFFHAGRTPDQRQVLMGLACPDLVAFFFDASGALLDVQTRRLEFMRPNRVLVNLEPIPGQVHTYHIDDERIPDRMDAWQREIGFEPGVIRVKAFFVPALGIGVEDYPNHFLDVLSHPGTSEAERQDVRDCMRLWDADGQFVLLWGNDYWLDAEGEVVSS